MKCESCMHALRVADRDRGTIGPLLTHTLYPAACRLIGSSPLRRFRTSSTILASLLPKYVRPSTSASVAIGTTYAASLSYAFPYWSRTCLGTIDPAGSALLHRSVPCLTLIRRVFDEPLLNSALLDAGEPGRGCQGIGAAAGPIRYVVCGVYIATTVYSAQAACAGNLFTAMDLADRDKLIEYVFPDGRLPVMTQVLL